MGPGVAGRPNEAIAPFRVAPFALYCEPVATAGLPPQMKDRPVRPSSRPLRILLVKPRPRLQTVLGLQGLQMLEPLELGYLAAMVPEHDVRVLDLRLPGDPTAAFAEVLAQFAPEVVGITGYSHEAKSIKELAAIVKSAQPRAWVVVGGHHATVAPQDLDLPIIDAVVRGEGTLAFRNFVDAIANDRDPRQAEHLIPTGKLFAVGEWPEFPDPASLPTPRRDLWRASDYYSVWPAHRLSKSNTIFPAVAMVRTSWGCRARCTFCVVPFLSRGKHQPRPVEAVVDELEGLAADHVYFSDDENFVTHEFARELATAIERRGLRKRYIAWARSTTVMRHPDLFEQWRRIGLDCVFMGFESIDDAELKRLHKGTTVDANEQAMEILRSLEIVLHASFMVRPDYTHEDFDNLVAYVEKMPPSQASFTVITPSPGTPDYERLEPEFWVDNPYDLHDCMHPLTPTVLPLPQYAARFADLVERGAAKTPLRMEGYIPPRQDALRVMRAERSYHDSFRALHQDYPGELWG